MKKSLLCIIPAILVTTSHAYAGIDGLTWHSRANCIGINESITWHLGHSYALSTDSFHYSGKELKDQKPKHKLQTGWQTTWRSADVHWTEGHGGWRVAGDHYIMDEKTKKPTMLGDTYAVDCNLYDGWWDTDKPEPVPPTIEQPKIYYSDSDSLPKPGVHIVPADKLSIPKEFLVKANARIKEMKSLGYVEEDSQDARELLDKGKNSYKYIEPNNDKYDTHMKHNHEAIKMAWSFVPIVRDNIGFAVAGTYIKGWTGITEYFNDVELGMCSYLVHNVALEHGGISISDDIVKYLVHDKPSTFDVEGNAKSGYLYTLSWYDPTFFKTLACARKDYDKSVMDKMVKFASKIDE